MFESEPETIAKAYRQASSLRAQYRANPVIPEHGGQVRGGREGSAIHQQENPAREERLLLRRGRFHPEEGRYHHAFQVRPSLWRLPRPVYQRGALTEAETNAFQGLAGLRKRFGNQTIYVPNALHTLSQILQAEGRLAEAESALREELALKQRLWQAKDPRVVQTASNLNQLLQLQGKPTE